MNKRPDIEQVEALLDTGESDKARELFTNVPEEESVAYFLLKGEIAQKYQQWGEAINAFNKVLELDASNEEATNNLHLIQNILNFWNPEMFNP
jgi:tetratricopeptide (TPR) repeat protein